MTTKLDKFFEQWKQIRASYKTDADALKAVEQNGHAFQYVKEFIFEHVMSV